jgi:hypothetical protein
MRPAIGEARKQIDLVLTQAEGQQEVNARFERELLPRLRQRMVK